MALSNRKNLVIGVGIFVVFIAVMGFFIDEIFPKYTEPGSRIKIVSADEEKGIKGEYKAKKETIEFSITEDVEKGERNAIFSSKKSKKNAAISVNDAEGELVSLEVWGIKWKSGDALTPEQEKNLKKFGESDLARSIIETAAYYPWKITNYAIVHRITIIQLYQELAKFYSPDNKKLIQPASPKVPDECFLKDCDLISEEAVFGCKDKEFDVDVMVLIDGLPTECRFPE